jgi:hypothetical protein
MKFRVWELIVLTSLIVISIIFSLLRSTWGGFIYFTSAGILAFIGVFINNRIYYLKCIRQEYDEGLQFYLTELYNNGLITKNQLIEGDERIIRGYYKDFRRTKKITIFLIIILVVILVTISLTLFNIW